LQSTLYLCSNHLGNIDDLPKRTLAVLETADKILCEDTRTIGRMLASLGIKRPLMSYHDHNEERRVAELRAELSGQVLKVAIISEAGMPLISDPGYRIVCLFHELNLPIEVIPGPAAFSSALIMSGFPLQQFMYIGFWPRKQGKQKEMINSIKESEFPFVFYESPKRLLKTFKLMQEIIPELKVFVVKELTKKFEKYWKGSIHDVSVQLENASQKGEFTIVVYNGKE